MTTETTSRPTSAVLGSRALRSAEWMAENAYIAPGFHRLLTAGGLTLGLLGGRKLMDVVTARSASNGEEISPGQTPEILRPIHGVMRYNPYSDAAVDRWKFVVDRIAPVTLGAVSAYWGGKLFFHGKLPGKESFSPATAAVKKAFGEEKYSTEVTDAMLRLRQSDATGKPASATFSEGSAAGQHLFGAWWPFNNGMVANRFMLGAGRNISFPLLPKVNRWLGNYGGSSRYMYGAMRDTAKWMEANVMKFDRAEEWAHPDILLWRAKDGLQKFPQRTANEEQKLVGAFQDLIRDAYAFKRSHAGLSDAALSAKVYEFVSGAYNGRRGLLGASYDHMLNGLGFDLSKVRLARDPWAFFSRLFGSRPHEEEILRKHGRYLHEAHGYFAHDTEQAIEAWAGEQLRMMPWKVAATYTGAAAAIGTGLVGAGVAGARLHRESSHTHKPHLNPEAEDTSPSAPSKEKHSGNLVDWVNGKPLDVAQWLGRVVITPPSMHRFMNAAYLSLFLYGGMKFGNVLTGRKLAKVMSGALTKEGIAESVIEAKDVWLPFRPLHNVLAYTPGSAATQDRWRQAAHFIIPVSVGVFGTYTGSHLYFKDREKNLETPKTLEDYADRIAFEQSKVYAGATAVTSIFNTGSGIHLLPVFNYSSNLHNRFLMGSGQQVAMPGIGKWWSGNAGTTPWGVKRSLTYIANYLTYNDNAHVKELPSLVHSVIGKLYPALNEAELLDRKQTMLDRIQDVRQNYLIAGKVPPEKRQALGDAMRQLLSGPGFEALLQESGLDPAKANLASNGASGAIANALGKKREVVQLQEEYRRHFAERAARQPKDTARVFIKELIEQPQAAPDTKLRFATHVATLGEAQAISL